MAVVGAVVDVAVAFGAPISQTERSSLVQLAEVLAPVLVAAEVAIQHLRSKAKPAPVVVAVPPVPAAPVAPVAPAPAPPAA